MKEPRQTHALVTLPVTNFVRYPEENARHQQEDVNPPEWGIEEDKNESPCVSTKNNRRTIKCRNDDKRMQSRATCEEFRAIATSKCSASKLVSKAA